MATSLELEPVAVNFTLKDHIHAVLRDAIMSMNIYDENTDTRLDERKMAEQLGISRTPVREALARLEQDGFVEILPRKGVFVRRKTLEEVLDMIVVWAALESMAARLSTELASDDELVALKNLAVMNGRSPNACDEYSEANIRFHQRIINLSQCKLIMETADGLFLHMHAVRRRAMTEGNRASLSVPDHLEIVDALRSRDGDLAERLVREHTMRLHDHVRMNWSRFERPRIGEVAE
ncbi:MAG: GntR family transcriptional regulator [Rhodospirillales bacterium]